MAKYLTAVVAVCVVAFGLSGCATLTVTPVKEAKPAAKQPVKVGIQVRGERLNDALNDKEASALAAVSGKLFDNVVLLPPETLLQEPAALRTSHGVDYVMTSTINDITVNGNLNPLWFASIPLLFFKPFAPIVTFESIVTLDHSIRDTRTGSEVLRKQLTEVATDHYSPVNPQEKVRKLIGRATNNNFISMLEELNGKVTR